MKLNLTQADGNHLVTGYGEGWVQIDQNRLTAGFILTAEQIVPWGVESIESVVAEDFLPVVALAPEVFLLGTGAKLKFPHVACLKLLVESGLGYEIMDTPAACRTYNILMSEGRNVALAAII